MFSKISQTTLKIYNAIKISIHGIINICAVSLLLFVICYSIICNNVKTKEEIRAYLYENNKQCLDNEGINNLFNKN